MGKKRCWLTYVKRLFISDPKPKSQEKSKKWRWIFRRFKFRHYPAIEEASEKALSEATEEQRMHALAVAVATAAAAEAAVAAANAAAEVVRLTNIPHGQRLKNQHAYAATKIQSAYRGHLARKALSALKGLVKLQAVIRGELVRRSMAKKLSSMALLEDLKPRAEQRRVPTLLDCLNQSESRHSLSRREGIKSEELRLRCSTQRMWDLSLFPKDSVEALYLQKQEAIAKRERMKQYSFSHRERREDQSLQELMNQKESRKSSRFDQYVELEQCQRAEREKLRTFSHSNSVTFDASRLGQLRLRTACKQERMEELNSPVSQPRRSFCHVKHRSIGDEGSLPSSPVFPAYMAATESAKARSRSLSTPKQRLRMYETYSGDQSPYSLRLFSWNSLNGKVTRSNKRNSISHHNPSNFGTLN